jgi:hypothetical protein
MVFSGACSEYIDAHSCSEGEALRLSCLIGECMPLGLSGIDWGACSRAERGSCS